MNTLEKLEALKAGELDKVLEGSDFDPAFNYKYNKCFVYAKDNAAKVEVAKAVVGEVISILECCSETFTNDEQEALTLLNKLKEVL
jgi:hypothetical protein